ncbi:MAG: hypothetical protein OEZ28_06400, partial [Nitrospinota bacterium]|nr:hypothetical protein [Nitrospinota bacterium]
DAEIISSAIRLFPDMAVEIVIAALNAGVDVELVVSTAVLTAPDKVAEIVAAAVNLLPEQRDVIVKAAIGSGGDQDVVVRAALAAIWRANSLGGLFPVVDGGQGKGGMPIYNGSPS